MFFLLMLLEKHVNNMCFLHANGHISILYVGYRNVLQTGLIVRNFCHLCCRHRCLLLNVFYLWDNCTIGIWDWLKLKIIQCGLKSS